MSSGFQPSNPLSIGLSNNDGVQSLQFESPPSQSKLKHAAAGTSENRNASPRLSLNTLTLDELSEELDRRTKETQRLQDEVDNATKLALERFGCTYGIHNSPEQSCHSHRLKGCDSSADSTGVSTQQQADIQPKVCDLHSLNQEITRRDVRYPEEEQFEKEIDDCLQQLSGLQTHGQPKHEPVSLDEAVVNLRTELHTVQKEKDIVSDLRLRDSWRHLGHMEKMLCMLEELQNIKRVGDQRLQETEDQALALNSKVKTLELSVKEVGSSLSSQAKQCGDKTITSPNVANSSGQVFPAANLSEEFDSETNEPQQRCFLSAGHVRSEECCGLNELKYRMEDLIASLGQEMVLLSDKLSSSKDISISLSVKLELLNKLAERQTSLHQCQVGCLEQQLFQAQSQLVDAQQEKSLQQAEKPQFQLGQHKRCGNQQQCELQEEVKALRGRLEVAREQLCRGVEEESFLQALLEQRTREGKKFQKLLEEKSQEVQRRQQEAQQHFARLEEAERRCQTLHADGETLRLTLDDQKKMINILRLQMESNTHMTVQHSLNIDNLHQENNLLSNQLKQQKMENEQLRSELDQQKSNLAIVEQERQRLQASADEQSRRVQEESLEKQQVTIQLELQHMELVNLKNEHRQLQQLCSCKEEEHEGVVLQLQSQLRNVHDELDQVRRTLTTLEGADGHGLQAVMDMQEKITARREQIDSLQGKIQHLEEMMDKLYQEKRYQSLEHQRQLEELTFVREEKRQLSDELEALRSKDKQLRDRISQLEAILHKMSESFADCQDFIQLQDQEFFRMKLQHALDLKELQGQNMHTALNVPSPHLISVSPSARNAPPSCLHAPNTQQESPTRELKSVVRELQAVISENTRRPHTDNGSAVSRFHRRRSAPENVHRTKLSTDKAEEVKAVSRFRRKTYSSEPQFLKMAELNGKMTHKSFVARYTSSTELLLLGRRSPVHSLLTSDPSSQK